MQIDILDKNVSLTMNIFLIIANVINIIYNIPQMYRTYKTGTTRDLSGMTQILRFICGTIWMVYGIEINSFMLFLCNIPTIMSSIFLGGFIIRNTYFSKEEAEMEVPLNVLYDDDGYTSVKF